MFVRRSAHDLHRALNISVGSLTVSTLSIIPEVTKLEALGKPPILPPGLDRRRTLLLVPARPPILPLVLVKLPIRLPVPARPLIPPLVRVEAVFPLSTSLQVRRGIPANIDVSHVCIIIQVSTTSRTERPIPKSVSGLGISTRTPPFSSGQPLVLLVPIALALYVTPFVFPQFFSRLTIKR